MFPNPTCKISNYIIEPGSGLYNLYLSPEMQTESGIKRCLAVASTIEELIGYVHTKQGDLYDTDILIEFKNTEILPPQYVIVNNNEDNIFVVRNRKSRP